MNHPSQPCRHCDGRGWVRCLLGEQVPCQTCDGWGKVTISTARHWKWRIVHRRRVHRAKNDSYVWKMSERRVIVMLDTSHDFDECEKELGCEVEQLLTPLTRFTRQRPDAHFAVDNGAFSNFQAEGFLSLLKREWSARHLCRFVAVPDVVGDARRTLEVFDRWHNKLSGWPIALVCQDGQENLPIPWDCIQAVFIGGSTQWKVGNHAAACIKAAKALGKWVHAGRVNTPARFEYFERLGADSIDGTGLSRFSWMRERIYEKAVKPNLFGGAA